MSRHTLVPLLAVAAVVIGPAAVPFVAGALPSGPPATSDEGRGAGPPTPSIDDSGACQSTYSFGSGLTAFTTCITADGNVAQFLVGGEGGPYEHIRVGDVTEGYTLCNAGATARYDAAGGTEGGFGAPTINQPGGPGTFPLTITRSTADGQLALQQRFTASATRTVTIKMAVTNTSAVSRTGVRVARFVDADIDNDGVHSTFIRTRRATTAFKDPGGGNLTLTATTRARAVTTTLGNYGVGAFDTCTGLSDVGIFGPADGVMKAVYELGTLPAGATREVVFTLTGD